MRALASGTIGAELYSDTDAIYTNEAVPQNTNKTTSTFFFGRTLHGLELVVTVGSTAVGLANGDILTIAFAQAEDDNFTSATYTTLYTKTFGASETIAVGTELVRYVADSKEGAYFRLRVTTDDTAATGTINAMIASVKKN